MRSGYAFLVLSLTGLCGAVALPAKQEEPTAEKVFKNITSFKGNKASDVIPAMQFMSASLKVDCEFCHTADRASDEKGAKGTAREMIEMQKDINAKNFGGRTQVTCATCHAGHPHPINLSPAMGVEVRARRNNAIKPEEILAAYGKAVGADPAKPIASLSLQGTTDKMPVEATYSGSKYTVVVKTPKGDSKQGFNGEMAWMASEKKNWKIPLTYAVAYVNQKTIYIGPDTLPKLTNLTGGTATIDGKDTVVVMGTQADKTRYSLYFDKQTNLLSRVSIFYPTVLGSIAQINDYSDYKKVNGVQLPMTIASHSAEADDVVHYHSAHLNGKINPTMFDPPAK